MKIIAYMAITPNGFIATPEGNTAWVSSADWDNFRNLAKRTGAVIIGRGTYDAMVVEGTFPLPGTLNVVMTANPPKVEPLKNVVFEDGSPEEVLENIKKIGHTEVILGGGGELLGSFMTDGLLDELYLTVEPVIFSEGIRLFGYGEFERQLELLDVNRTDSGEVRLHYAVRRSLDNILPKE